MYRMIVMDEVDGMGGSDRGGLVALLAVIKSSKVPIVCICNDRQSPKIRSLANNCYDLKVRYNGTYLICTYFCGCYNVILLSFTFVVVVCCCHTSKLLILLLLQLVISSDI